MEGAFANVRSGSFGLLADSHYPGVFDIWRSVGRITSRLVRKPSCAPHTASHLMLCQDYLQLRYACGVVV